MTIESLFEILKSVAAEHKITEILWKSTVFIYEFYQFIQLISLFIIWNDKTLLD